MAGLLLEVNAPQVAFTTATKTLMQVVAATNQRVKIKEWGVAFDGISNTGAPIEVNLLRQTTAGTMSALTPTKRDNGLAETIQTTAQHTSTGEPTAGDILRRVFIHPQTGRDYISPFGDEIMIPGGGRVGIRVVSPGAGADATAYMTVEE